MNDVFKNALAFVQKTAGQVNQAVDKRIMESRPTPNFLSPVPKGVSMQLPAPVQNESPAAQYQGGKISLEEADRLVNPPSKPISLKMPNPTQLMTPPSKAVPLPTPIQAEKNPPIDRFQKTQ